MCRINIEEIAILNGIRFKTMTNYRAELVHLRNEGLSYKEIAMRINENLKEIKVSDKIIEKWFTRETQPKDEIIKVLEDWLNIRIYTRVREIKKPTLRK